MDFLVTLKMFNFYQAQHGFPKLTWTLFTVSRKDGIWHENLLVEYAGNTYTHTYTHHDTHTHTQSPVPQLLSSSEVFLRPRNTSVQKVAGALVVPGYQGPQWYLGTRVYPGGGWSKQHHMLLLSLVLKKTFFFCLLRRTSDQTPFLRLLRRSGTAEQYWERDTNKYFTIIRSIDMQILGWVKKYMFTIFHKTLS